MNPILILQKTLLLLGGVSLIILISKVGETASCISFVVSYWWLIVFGALSLLLSVTMKYMGYGKRLFYTPVVFLFVFVVFIGFYRFGWVRIYEQSVGAYKGISYYERAECNNAIIKFFSTDENVF